MGPGPAVPVRKSCSTKVSPGTWWRRLLPAAPENDCDRWMKCGTTFLRSFDPSRGWDPETLPKKNIDTGMGLERLRRGPGRVYQFETDQFVLLIRQTEQLWAALLKASPGPPCALPG